MIRLPQLLVIAVLLFGATSPALAGEKEDARARNAVRVLADIQAIPESAIPNKLFDEAMGIVVIPDSLKVGLLLAGQSGHGLMSVKSADGTWSNPVFVQLTGGSIGLQVGVQSADIVLMFTSQRGLDSIVNGKITLGADASVAAGPVGRSTSMATDGQLEAEIWSWSRARGLFAGVALEGAVLSIDDDANIAVYGPNTTPRMIFEGRAGSPDSATVVSFRDSLEEATAAARYARGTAGTSATTASTAVTGTTATRAIPVGTSPVATAPLTTPASAPQPTPFEPVPLPTPVPAPAAAEHIETPAAIAPPSP